MVRILHFTVTGQAMMEKTRVNARYLEMPDGDHPMTNDSFWQDSERRQMPIIAFFEGVPGALGSDMVAKDMENILTEIELIKLSFRNQGVSKMWVRAIMRMFGGVFKVGLPTLIFIFMAYFIVQAMLEGGV